MSSISVRRESLLVKRSTKASLWSLPLGIISKTVKTQLKQTSKKHILIITCFCHPQYYFYPLMDTNKRMYLLGKTESSWLIVRFVCFLYFYTILYKQGNGEEEFLGFFFLQKKISMYLRSAAWLTFELFSRERRSEENCSMATLRSVSLIEQPSGKQRRTLNLTEPEMSTVCATRFSRT